MEDSQVIVYENDKRISTKSDLCEDYSDRIVSDITMSTLLKELEFQKSQIKDKERIINFLERENEETVNLRSAMKEKKEVIKNLNSKIEQFGSLTRDIEQKNAIIEQLNTEIKEIKYNMNQKDQKVVEKLKDKRNELRAKNLMYSELETKFEVLDDKYHLVKGKATSLSSKNDKLQREINQLESKIEDYENQVKDLKIQLKEHTRNPYIEENKEMRIAINDKKIENERLLSEYNDLKRLKDENIQQLQTENEDLQKNYNNLETLIASKSHAIAAMKEKIREINDRPPADPIEIKRLKREVEERRLEIDTMVYKFQIYKNCLEESYQNCDNYKKANMELLDRINGLDEEIVKLKRLNLGQRKNLYPDWWKDHMMY